MKRFFGKIILLFLFASALSALVPHAAVFAEETGKRIEISDAAGFGAIRDDPSGSYLLTADIVLPENFLPIAEFSGTLDGNGRSVTVKATGEYEDGYAPIMKNLGALTGINAVCDIKITAGDYAFVGGIVAENYGELSGCSVSGCLFVTANGGTSDYIYAGGVAGYSEADISECASSVEISLKGRGIVHVGGIAGGTTDCVVMNCDSSASVCGEGSNVMAGGLVGECDGKAGYSSFSGSVSAKAFSVDGKNSYAYAGGISGYALDHMVQCENSGTVTAKGEPLTSAYAGGGCGIIYGRINRFENSGKVSAEAGLAIFAGGAAGRVGETAAEVKNTAGISASGSSATATVGGAAGKASSLEKCTSDADISVSAAVIDVGGICGECENVSGCVSSGRIEASARELRAGGISGNSRFITGCESSCALKLSGQFTEIFAGGIAAKALTSISASAFSGSVDVETAGGYIYAGGIVAYNCSSALNCKATPSITVRMETVDASGVIAVGCIAGGNYGRIAECKGTAKIYANAILNTTVHGSGRKISVFAGNNAGLTRGGGSVSDSAAQSRINAYIISGGVAKPKLNYD